jgi:SpoIID/LytB domain protein
MPESNLEANLNAGAPANSSTAPAVLKVSVAETLPMPEEDELVAIAAAVQSYIASLEAESMAARYTLEQQADTANSGSLMKSLSPWAVAGRTESSRTKKPVTWRNFCGALLFATGLASTLSISQLAYGAPPVLAQSAGIGSTSDLAAAATSAQAFYGSWSFADKSQNIKVMIGAPSQKVDLDLPDGGSIYSADGALVARVGPRSSWTLNLASAGAASTSMVSQNPVTGMSQIVPRKKIVFTGKGALDLAQTSASNQNIAASAQRQDYQKAAFTPSGGANFVESRFALPPDAASGGYLVIPEADSSQGAPPIVGVNGKLYRGCLLLRPFAAAAATGASSPSATGDGAAIAVINVLKVEDYLLSVVPSEVPASWPQEVLKAQAITARSYAFANLGKHKVDGYDVKDTVEDQVYKGVMTENNNTNTACANTVGLVLKQNDQVISAFFHSTSGGMTELAENVWSKSLPYLKSVPDYDDASPYFSWQRSFTVPQLNKILIGGDSSSASEQLTGLFVVSRYKSDAQRVHHVVATSTGAGRVLTGAEMRKLLNLPSTQFSVYQADGAYVFSGHGFGHGLGLSQWGAKALADKGYNAGQILSYYYKDVTIDQIGSSGGFSGPNGSI